MTAASQAISATFSVAERAAVAIAVFLATALHVSAQEALQVFQGCTLVPTEWADGDSFRVKFPDGTERTVRLYGADCLEWHVRDESDARRLREQRRYFGIAGPSPEESVARARALGGEAAKFVATRLGEPFTVHTAFADGRGDERFERIYAFVTTSDGRDLASGLVEAGLARAFGVSRQAPGGQSAAEYRESLRDLELVAASNRRGIWAATDWDRLAEERRTQRADDVEIRETLTPPVPENGVDPNTASRDELMSLPGIGETLALRIIEARTQGPYRSAADLSRVQGVGNAAAERLAPLLRFPPPPG